MDADTASGVYSPITVDSFAVNPVDKDIVIITGTERSHFVSEDGCERSDIVKFSWSLSVTHCVVRVEMQREVFPEAETKIADSHVAVSPEKSSLGSSVYMDRCLYEHENVVGRRLAVILVEWGCCDSFWIANLSFGLILVQCAIISCS